MFPLRFFSFAFFGVFVQMNYEIDRRFLTLEFHHFRYNMLALFLLINNLDLSLALKFLNCPYYLL